MPVFGIGDRVVITDSFKHEGVIRRIYRDEIKAYNVVGDFGGGMYGAWELKHAEQEDEGDFARYSRAQLIAYICELREEEQAAPDVALELPDGEEATRSSQGCQCGQTHEWCKANECPALPAATAAAQPTLPDDERAAFFAWFAEHGGPYGSVKDAQDVFSAGYRAALRQPPAGGRGEDAERLSWLADRVLACDYGDNDDPGHRNGWYIRSDLIPIGGKAQAAFMYGKSISEAIDAARAAASPAQEKQAGEDA